MSLILTPGWPNTNVIGSEMSGVGVDPVSKMIVAPNGTSGTKAEIDAKIAEALKGGHSVFGLRR